MGGPRDERELFQRPISAVVNTHGRNFFVTLYYGGEMERGRRDQIPRSALVASSTARTAALSGAFRAPRFNSSKAFRASARIRSNRDATVSGYANSRLY
jgi:hypothetical protein